MKIKVCGITTVDQLNQLERLRIDYAGLIFYNKSPRFIGETLKEQKDAVKNTSIKKIGVFVNEPLTSVIQAINDYDLSVVQLHGDEPISYCASLKKHTTVIKAFRVSGGSVIKEDIAAYADVIDYYLFDTAIKKGEKEIYGGTGKKFSWEILEHLSIEKPFFLSGGIGPEELGEIIPYTHEQLYAIDLNSKFEIKPGVKNIPLLSRFCYELRATKDLPMNNQQATKTPTASGFYGKFGGAYIPELLYQNVEELRTAYLNIIQSPDLQLQYQQLLRDYVGRPTPLYHAKRLSQQYNTNVYLKREDLCHTGAHKINNTIGQILVAEQLGKKRIIAETGAGQHGVATATVCALKGIECVVYMGSKDMQRQSLNVARMKMLGAKVIPATSGSQTLKDATNEAIRDWINNPTDTHYIIGSVVGPHPYPDMVARFQSVISEEIRRQLLSVKGKETPTHVIASVGGGSNAAGAFYHFIDEASVDLIAVEAAGLGIDSGHTAATTQKGSTGVLHGSKTLLMQNEDGQVLEAHSISAGLDYPGIGPMHAHLFESGRAKYLAATDQQALDAAFVCARLEGIIPALESAHAIAALDQVSFKKDDVVIICLSGRGDKDISTYMQQLTNEEN